MELNIRSITTAAAVLVMSAVAASAQDWTQNLYAKIDGGGMFQQNATLDKTTSSSVPPAISTSGTATFNFGVRGDIALGYNINKSWAAEFDTGVLWNSMDKVGNNTLGSIGQSADTYTVPFLANFIYKVPIKGPWSSYVGLGVGGAASILSYDNSGYSLSDCNFTFAYQAEAGLKYALSQNASINIAYEFLGMTDPSWNSSLTVGATTTDYQFKENGFYTHSIAVSFTWNF